MEEAQANTSCKMSYNCSTIGLLQTRIPSFLSIIIVTAIIFVRYSSSSVKLYPYTEEITIRLDSENLKVKVKVLNSVYKYIFNYYLCATLKGVFTQN